MDYEFSHKEFQKIWENMQADIDALLIILHNHVNHSNACNFTVNDIQKGEDANRLKDNIYFSYQRFRRIYLQWMTSR